MHCRAARSCARVGVHAAGDEPPRSAALPCVLLCPRWANSQFTIHKSRRYPMCLEPRTQNLEPRPPCKMFVFGSWFSVLGSSSGCSTCGLGTENCDIPLLLRCFLLDTDRRALLAAPRAGVGLGALTTQRQTSAMAQAAIAADVHQALDVELHLTAQDR